MGRISLVLACLALGCGRGPEGSVDGDCDDNKDNDSDGKYDCDDDGCAVGELCVRQAEQVKAAAAATLAAEEKKRIEEAKRLEAEASSSYFDLSGLWVQKGHNEANIAHGPAREYCDKLVLAEHDDWRLPTAQEAVQMHKSGKLAAEPYVMWSSTMNGKKRASIVGITSGAVNDLGVKFDGDVRARCVRGAAQ